jgi:release factor glutamine methyltransferase
MLKKGLRLLLRVVYKPLLEFYLRKSRPFSFKGLRLEIEPEVFHPGFFFSSKVMLRFIDTLSLKNTKVLELGSGSGILSLYCAKLGAKVTACDISKKAVNNTIKNRDLNGLEMEVYHSDLFSSLPQQTFDIILVNPPYYKKKPDSEAEHAWYCGENGEYFENFFSGLNTHTNQDSVVYMVLSDGVDLEMIENFAGKRNFICELVYSEYNLVEHVFVLSIGLKKTT